MERKPSLSVHQTSILCLLSRREAEKSEMKEFCWTSQRRKSCHYSLTWEINEELKKRENSSNFMPFYNYLHHPLKDCPATFTHLLSTSQNIFSPPLWKYTFKNQKSLKIASFQFSLKNSTPCRPPPKFLLYLRTQFLGTLTGEAL